jgi:LmbE family N-acetylglucosaminyl deacetylase
MLSLALPPGPLRILCLGAHADDIEIGCGGTILALLAARRNVNCHWVVFSGAGGPREREARESASQFLAGAGARGVEVHQFRDGHFPAALCEIKEVLEAVKRAFTPDVVFAHCRDDRHQDHGIVSDVAWQTFRDHLILEYEIPKWDGDLGQPNLYVPLPRDTALRKTEHLLAAFPSQRSKRWFTDETFLALLRLRGVESGAPEGLAEAFYARKAVVTW